MNDLTTAFFDLRYGNVACTLPCLRLVARLLPPDANRAVRREAHEVATRALVAAGATYSHREGLTFWPHGRPYVKAAITKWLSQRN